jgi:hypothetical protein
MPLLAPQCPAPIPPQHTALSESHQPITPHPLSSTNQPSSPTSNEEQIDALILQVFDTFPSDKPVADATEAQFFARQLLKLSGSWSTSTTTGACIPQNLLTDSLDLLPAHFNEWMSTKNPPSSKFADRIIERINRPKIVLQKHHTSVLVQTSRSVPPLACHPPLKAPSDPGSGFFFSSFSVLCFFFVWHGCGQRLQCWRRRIMSEKMQVPGFWCRGDHQSPDWVSSKQGVMTLFWSTKTARIRPVSTKLIDPCHLDPGLQVVTPTVSYTMPVLWCAARTSRKQRK